MQTDSSNVEKFWNGKKELNLKTGLIITFDQDCEFNVLKNY